MRDLKPGEDPKTEKSTEENHNLKLANWFSTLKKLVTLLWF
jgi:hypothetical protein